MPTRSSWNTPIRMLGAPARLVSGPRMLKMVRTPSSLRTGATFFMAGWWLGANMKPMPVCATEAAMRSGERLRLAPSASITSALPDLLLTLRPPCLAVLALAAAATNIEQVEMLKVCEPSPPVPTMSTRCVVSATCTLVENSRMTCAAAVISPMVSFFTRKPVMMAAVMTGESSPFMIMRIRCSISSWKISRCSIARCRASWAVMGLAVSDSTNQEIFQHGVAVLGQDGFGVELHPLDVELSVAHAHDLAVVGPGGDLQAGRAALALDGQRVVTVDGELFGQAGEHAFLRGGDDAGLAVHLHLRPHDLAAKGRADTLVSEANAQDRQFAGKVLDGGDRDAGFGRRAGAGRDHQTVRLTRRAPFERDLVITENFDCGAEFAKVLHDVEGERVVVVHHEQFDLVRHGVHSSPSSTNSLARSRARALCSVSRHSISGTESATTPAAACTYNVWSLMTAVRIAIATSMSPA